MRNSRRMQIGVLVLVFIPMLVLMSVFSKTVYAQSGGFLKLDGFGDKAEATTTIFPASSTLTSFTVEAWIYPTRRATKYIARDEVYVLSVNYHSEASNDGMGIGFSVFADESGNLKGTVEYRDVTLNQWNHVVGIFDAEASPNPKITLIINGKVSASPLEFTADGFFSGIGNYFVVGGDIGQWGSSDDFQGYIDEVRVSNNVRYSNDFNPDNYPYFPCDGHTKALFHFNEPDGSLSATSDCGIGYILTAVDGAHITNPPAPAITTGSTTTVTCCSATLNGTVNPNGQSTEYYFEYGTTTSYGSSTPIESAGSGSDGVSVKAVIKGLFPSATYHYRLVATYMAGTIYGSDQSFVTEKAKSMPWIPLLLLDE
jgi:hypothetical protein